MLDDDHVAQLVEHVHAVPNSAGMIEEYQTKVAERKAVKLETLAAGRDTMPALIRDASFEVAQGHVVETIIKKVRDDQIDLLVVGARRLGRIGRLLGSTTEGLLAQCPCSLLIVHDADD